ncbi:MAG: electron transfer flavoprotein subunit beta/FixA family protein [Phycisphaerae bacterium]|nr:electron transfer flavoprotein subunit beta/FixA family protein [Phycisphaerae bacterium]
MGYNCVVLAKQVPDTKGITGKAMKDDGTVNRAALPAIFNPEDLHALEMALSIKDRFGGTVTVITMGLPAACEILRASLYRGADRAILITDRRAAGSDTLATSYILNCAVRKLGKVDIVLCGRQAIDGDTAQVGPQTAEKLGMTQASYVEKLLDIKDGTMRVRRNLGHGWEIVEGKLPMLLTITDAANEPRPPAARKLMKHKAAKSPAEIERDVNDATLAARKADIAADVAKRLAATPNAERAEIERAAAGAVLAATEAERKAEVSKRLKDYAARGLLIDQWNLDDIKPDLQWVGLTGSPTKVHRIQSIVLTASGFTKIEPTAEGITNLVHELIEDHTIG